MLVLATAYQWKGAAPWNGLNPIRRKLLTSYTKQQASDYNAEYRTMHVLYIISCPTVVLLSITIMSGVI